MFGRFFKKPIDIFSYSNIGGRQENEDTCAVFEKQKNEYCCVVADGLGGHGGGARASRTAAAVISEHFLSDEIENPEDFNTWFQKANQAVLEIQSPDCRMKTTLVTLYIKDKSAMWAHIGDSRLYHFVEGKLAGQTLDHSVSQMAVFRGEITPEEVRGHVDRNRLLRALGSEKNIRIDVSEESSLKGKQHAFLLCTDGFWEYIYETEMEEALAGASSAKEWLQNMLGYMKRRMRKDNDNNTAITVIVNEK